jgi:hypothetical protein
MNMNFMSADEYVEFVERDDFDEYLARMEIDKPGHYGLFDASEENMFLGVRTVSYRRGLKNAEKDFGM